MSRCQGADSIITCKALAQVHFFSFKNHHVRDCQRFSSFALYSRIKLYWTIFDPVSQHFHPLSGRKIPAKEGQVKSMQTLLLKACRYVKLHIKGKKKTDSNTLDDQCNVWKCQYTFIYTKFIHNPLVKEIPFRICNDFYHNSCYIQECYFLNPLLQGNPGKVFQKCNKTWPRYPQD